MYWFYVFSRLGEWGGIPEYDSEWKRVVRNHGDWITNSGRKDNRVTPPQWNGVYRRNATILYFGVYDNMTSLPRLPEIQQADFPRKVS